MITGDYGAVEEATEASLTPAAKGVKHEIFGADTRGT